MSIDKSLVVKSRLKRHRNVLTRAERIDALREDGRWDDSRSVFGLPKVRNIKKTVHKEAKAAAEATTAAAAETKEATPPAEKTDKAGKTGKAGKAGKTGKTGKAEG